jgi:hypothetical protein
MQDLLIILILNVVGALCYPFDPENMATIRSTFGLPELPYSLGLRLHLALLFAFGSNIRLHVRVQYSTACSSLFKTNRR